MTTPQLEHDDVSSSSPDEWPDSQMLEKEQIPGASP